MRNSSNVSFLASVFKHMAARRRVQIGRSCNKKEQRKGVHICGLISVFMQKLSTLMATARQKVVGGEPYLGVLSTVSTLGHSREQHQLVLRFR